MFVVEDYGELRALFQSLMRAKFTNGSDVRLATSPVVARALTHMTDALAKNDYRRGVGDAAYKWRTSVTPGCVIWRIALRNAISAHGVEWMELSASERARCVEVALSPYQISDAQTQLFVLEVTKQTARSTSAKPSTRVIQQGASSM